MGSDRQICSISHCADHRSKVTKAQERETQAEAKVEARTQSCSQSRNETDCVFAATSTSELWLLFGFCAALPGL